MACLCPPPRVQGAAAPVFSPACKHFNILRRPTSFVYLDGQNALIGAAQISAARRRLAASPQAAAAGKICDPCVRLNFSRLLKFVVGDEDEVNIRAVCFNSVRNEDDDRIHKAAERAGWEVRTYVRSPCGKEKQTDTAIATHMVMDVMSSEHPPSELEISIISGDRDFLPPIQALREKGYGVDVLSWEHLLSAELRRAARKCVILDEQFPYLTFRREFA